MSRGRVVLQICDVVLGINEIIKAVDFGVEPAVPILDQETPRKGAKSGQSYNSRTTNHLCRMALQLVSLVSVHGYQHLSTTCEHADESEDFLLTRKHGETTRST